MNPWQILELCPRLQLAGSHPRGPGGGRRGRAESDDVILANKRETMVAIVQLQTVAPFIHSEQCIPLNASWHQAHWASSVKGDSTEEGRIRILTQLQHNIMQYTYATF